tara:strand:- start:139 stop:513 length:375 start_codon:yes stop_codon:yes gene_type:complete
MASKKKKKKRCWKGYKPTPGVTPYDKGSCMKESTYQRVFNLLLETAAWQRKEGQSKSGGLNAAGRRSYKKGTLKAPVTQTKPKGKAKARKKSFCARMSGMRKRQKSSNNTGKDRLSLSLRKWNC